MRSLIALLIALSLLVAACGSSDDDGDDGDDGTTTTAAAETTSAPDTTAAPATTAVPETTAAPPTTAAPQTTAAAGGDAATSPIAVSLSEWEVDAPEVIAAGPVEFVATNGGTFTHELAVARGDSYETLPQLDNGAVDEDTLGTDFIGRSERVDAGGDTQLMVDLEPGNYVLFCNIAVGPNSHAAQGQVLSVTVQ